ncbi:MAG: tRNA (adenosine(37)-N6)-threonylcarbamoyltransferase complex ATPase subunit type 1 TsaE [Polyangiales bacterium]
MHEVDVEDEEGTRRLAEALASLVEPGDVILLEGGLGAGKTTFFRYVARALGVPEDEPVTSPTFALVHEYEARVPLVHADLYRLGHPDELHELGLADRVGVDAVAFVEWGEAHVAGLGRVDLRIRIAARGDSRRFELAPASARGASIVTRLAATRGAR